MKGVFFHNKDKKNKQDKDYDIDQIYKAKNILEREKCQGWEIKKTRFENEILYFFLYSSRIN
jgi:hypothetical protein